MICCGEKEHSGPSPRSFSGWRVAARSSSWLKPSLLTCPRMSTAFSCTAPVASTIGTAIEWYDFFLYSTVTGLVFAQRFFPESDPLVGTLQALGIYAVGFVARPIGAGHFRRSHRTQGYADSRADVDGDRDLPRGAGPDLRKHWYLGGRDNTILWFVQGVGVGGDGVAHSMEWSRSHGARGFIVSWPQFGVPCGLFLANLAVLAFSWQSGDEFLVWGWRVPFALSIELVGIGL